MSSATKLFAWDFHGTLEVGTEVGFALILREIAKEIKYKTKIKLGEVQKLFGLSVIDYLKHFFPKLSDKEILELRELARTNQNRKHLEKHIKPAPYADMVLGKIKDSGHINIIVSTSADYHIKHFLEVVGLDIYVDKIFGIDRHSFKREFNIAHEKSKVIKSFAKKKRIESNNIVVIGDRAGDIDAGKLVGATTYQYVNPNFGKIETEAERKVYDLRDILREI